jgi:hypothetical protein
MIRTLESNQTDTTHKGKQLVNLIDQQQENMANLVPRGGKN